MSSRIITPNKKTPDQIKTIVVNSFKPGDKIHISKNNRIPIINEPATFKGAFNHLITIEAAINNTMRIFSITYTDLYTGNTVIHELSDQLEVNV